MSDNIVQRQRTNGVSGRAILAIESDGRIHARKDCLTTVGSVDGVTSRKTVVKRDAVEEEPLKITQKCEAVSWGLEPM